MKAPFATSLGIAAALALAGVGCSTNRAVNDDTDTVSARQGSPTTRKETVHATLSFDEKSAELTSSEKDELQRIVRDVRAKLGEGDRIDRITVAAWSDKRLPGARQKLARAGKSRPSAAHSVQASRRKST